MIDYKKLKELRSKTGVSFSICKKALESSKNDMNKAMKYLKDLGSLKMKEKMERSTKAGSLFSYIHHNGLLASLIELSCETDFVANNQAFKDLGHEIAMQTASLKPKNINVLLDQEYIKDPTKKIKDLINDNVLKFGEKIKITKILFWEFGLK